MQLCGKLPQDTAVDLELTDLYEPSEEPSRDSFSKHAFLTEEQHFHLDMFYRRVDSDYKNVVTYYESEKKKSDHSSPLEECRATYEDEHEEVGSSALSVEYFTFLPCLSRMTQTERVSMESVGP